MLLLRDQPKLLVGPLMYDQGALEKAPQPSEGTRFYGHYQHCML